MSYASPHAELEELDRFLSQVERGGDWTAHPPPRSPLVARIRTLLETERAASQRIVHVESGLDTIASSLMQLATGDFALQLGPQGQDEMVDAAFVGLSMLAEELEHSRSAMESARDQALEANRSKSAFLANMSHELRTPLNAIIGYCELVSDELEDLAGGGGLRGDLDRVLSSAHHLLGLISDVLDLSKIEAGRIELDLQPFDPAPVVEEVGRAMLPKAATRNNILSVNAAPGTVMLADSLRLKQVLFNLIGNALKFTENGQVDVELTANADWVVIRIADTGPGIDPARHEAIFSPFVQADSKTTVTFGGTGLGLAITQRLCRLMGGDVCLRSTLGKGATLTVTLPLAAAPSSA